MPEKSRQRRVKVSKRRGTASAIKSTDVGKAKGLSRHAAKKSRHVEGVRFTEDRHVGRSRPPAKSRIKEPTEVEALAMERPELHFPPGGRAPGFEHERARQKVISRRSRSVAAKVARKKKSPR